MDEMISRMGAYPPRSKLVRPVWALASLSERVGQIIRTHSYDVTILQRELLSTFSTLERFSGRPRILDVDDAIWFYRNGTFAQRLAGACDMVICGNEFLADWFSRWNAHTYVLPTGVDADRFIPGRIDPMRRTPRLMGWSGSQSGLHYLYDIEEELQTVLGRVPDLKLRVICNSPPRFRMLRADQIEFVRWSPENEVRALQDLDIGLMPLADTLWERGKCSYKMLTYMSCAVPVVVSDVGMNATVLKLGHCGLGVSGAKGWAEAIEHILANPTLSASMGTVGRDLIQEHYSVEKLAGKFTQLMRTAYQRRNC
jgi:glycosyltransferase involved in cell wall biosynthesis